MKKNELTLIKGQTNKELTDKAKGLRKGIADSLIDLNMKKLKDTKSVFKKRKELAQVLTILRQKQILEQLEFENSNQLVKGDRTALSK